MSEPRPNTRTADGRVSRRARTVRLERVVPAAVDRVWRMWTEPERLARWLGPVLAGTPGPASTFVLGMDADETATCTVTEWQPPNRLGLTWRYTGEDATTLRIELADIGDGTTRLVLEHEGIAPTGLNEYAAGWHLHLEALTAELTDAARPDFGADFPPLLAAYDALDPT
jgi:uncharacterized protein YndB with AHSA1/START domain